VRVVDIGGVSLEFCGGTHLQNTQTAGVFKLLSESGVAAGTRRIEALTGPRALAYYREADARLQEASALLKTTPDKLAERVTALSAEVKQLQREVTRVKTEQAGAGEAEKLKEIFENIIEVNGFKIQKARIDGLDANELRSFSDKLRDKLDAFVLCSVNGGAVQFIAAASDAAVKKGANAGQAVKEAAVICGGGGGGRPNTAQAGGKDASKADEALEKALAVLKGQLG
jgi:alanyl-tRNA synthetase